MKKIFLFLILILFSTIVLACDNTSSQCLKVTSFKIMNSSGQETDVFSAGDTIYVDFSVKNIGIAKVENSKLYLAFRAKSQTSFSNSNYVMPNGITAVYGGETGVGIDIESGDEISFSGVKVVISPFAPPIQFEMDAYAMSESFQNFNYIRKYFSVTNPNDNWVAAQATKLVTCFAGTTTCANRLMFNYEDDLPDKFDLRVGIQSKNTTNTTPIRVLIDQFYQITGCDSYPSEYSGGKVDRVIDFAPGEYKEFVFSNCEMKEIYKDVERAFRVYIYSGEEGVYLTGGWPGVKPTAKSMIHNLNMWADKDYLVAGETNKVTSRFYIFDAPIGLGSKGVFTFSNVVNANGEKISLVPLEYFFTQEEVDASGTWSKIYEVSVDIDNYLSEIAAGQFTIVFNVYDEDGTLVPRNYRSNVVNYSPAPTEILSLDDFDEGYVEHVIEQNSSSMQTILIETGSKSADDLVISGADKYSIMEVDEGVLVFYWPQIVPGSNPTEYEPVTFSMIIQEAAPTPGLLESAILIVVGMLFLFFYLSRDE